LEWFHKHAAGAAGSVRCRALGCYRLVVVLLVPNLGCLDEKFRSVFRDESAEVRYQRLQRME
jgi:hypothetical protein